MSAFGGKADICRPSADPFRTLGIGCYDAVSDVMEGLMIKFVRVLAELVLACGLSTAASAQTKWDVPTPYPDGNFHTRNVAMFAVDMSAIGGKADMSFCTAYVPLVTQSGH